jgi:hypothetical protein
MNINQLVNCFLNPIKSCFKGEKKAKASKSNDSELRAALTQLNTEYLAKESFDRPEGYRVLFEEKPTFQAQLVPMGNNFRKTDSLSGVPENKNSYQENHCPFCSSTVKVIKIFEDHCQAIRSHSGQVLLIPNTHYAHWFEMPLEVQLTLLKHALELRKTDVHSNQHPLELHCGSAGYQTVFHTHLRTGIFN